MKYDVYYRYKSPAGRVSAESRQWSAATVEKLKAKLEQEVAPNTLEWFIAFPQAPHTASQVWHWHQNMGSPEQG